MEKTTGQEVLVVDDEFDSVKPLIRILEKEGCKPHYVADAAGAIRALEQVAPDLIIIDVLLGRDNGFDLFVKLRELPPTADVPILFLSGLDQVDATVAGLNLGAHDFITKPYNLREIAARINLQLRLREHEKLLKRRNEELSKAYDELRAAQAAAIQAEKLAAIGRLSAGIAHEMSTPLSFVISNLKMLRTYLGTINEMVGAYQGLAEACAGGADASVQAREVLALRERLGLQQTLRELSDLSRDCVEGAEAIAKIANDLREFSREEYEDLVSADINVLVDKALTLLRNELGTRIRVEREAGAPPLLPCLPGRVTQLLLIILVNAIQAIDPRREGLIRIRTQADADHLTLTITDNGCGIPADVLPHIFEPFYTTKPSESGTGLGLSIARKIMDFHGGRVVIASEPGRGTEVTLVFPLKRPENPQPS